MNTYLKKLRPMALLMALFMLTNCHDDADVQVNVDTTNQTVNKRTLITGDHARKAKQDLVKLLKQKGGIGITKLSKTIFGNDITKSNMKDIEGYIDGTKFLRIIQADGIVNDTYRVNLPDIDGNKFYNLVVQTQDGSSKPMLMAFEMEKEFALQYALDGNFSNFTGIIRFEALYEGEIDYPCTGPPGIPIPVKGGSGPGGGGPGNYPDYDPTNTGNQGTPYNQILVDIKFLELQMPSRATSIETGPIEGGNDGSLPGSLPTPGGRYTVLETPSVQNGNPCADSVEIGILDPEKVPNKKNCEELEKMSKDPKINAKLTYLNNKTDEKREFGYGYSDDALPMELKLKEGSENLIQIKVGGTYYGASHTHPNQNNSFFSPMFSISDILSLAILKKRYNIQADIPDDSKFVFTLTVQKFNLNETETYAVKIENWFEFQNFIDEFQSRTPEERTTIAKDLAEQYGLVDKTSPEGINNYLLKLLKYMDKIGLKGVGIYKATDEAFSNWQRKMYDTKTKNIITVPCK